MTKRFLEEQNGLEPYAYLRKVFRKLPAEEQVEDIEALLPWRLTIEKLKATLTPSRMDWWIAYVQPSIELVGTLWTQIERVKEIEPRP